MRDFDLLLLGMPTWSVGQMQRDWQAVFEELDALELTGRPVALFGLGDQVGYPDTFADALAFLADKLQERGAHLFGAWPADGYTFTSSWALRPDGHFVGLILDEENQPHLTTQRCTEWIAALRAEYLQHVRAAPGLPAQSA
jgi:flavodoxin I